MGLQVAGISALAATPDRTRVFGYRTQVALHNLFYSFNAFLQGIL